MTTATAAPPVQPPTASYALWNELWDAVIYERNVMTACCANCLADSRNAFSETSRKHDLESAHRFSRRAEICGELKEMLNEVLVTW